MPSLILMIVLNISSCENFLYSPYFVFLNNQYPMENEFNLFLIHNSKGNNHSFDHGVGKADVEILYHS